MGTSRHGPWLKMVLLGIAVGVGLFASAAVAMQYTDQRPFCSSCHVMHKAGVTHKMSTHANVSCNECHAPTNLMSKIPFKVASGMKDIASNMSGKDVALDIGVSTKDVVNANCKSCHAMTNMGVASMEAKPYCVDCHRNVAHMRKKPISTRMVADE